MFIAINFEIVLDLGRRPEARFTTGPEYLSQRLYLGKISITLQNACKLLCEVNTS
jgi:hypothetical protein